MTDGLRYSAVQYGTVRYSTVRYGTVQYDMVREHYGMDQVLKKVEEQQTKEEVKVWR